MRIYLVVASMAALALAGCASEDPDLQSISDDLRTQAVDALGADAALYSIVGFEPREKVDADETEGCGPIPADRKPGDGVPSVWAHIYAVPGATTGLVVISDRSGDVRCQLEEEIPMEGLVPLTDWNVSSEEAADIVAENVDDYAALVADAEIIFTLADAGEGPFWGFIGFSEDLAVTLMWGVDARTGAFLSELPEVSTGGVPAAEGGIVEGATTGSRLLAFITPATFSIAEGHAKLDLVVDLEDPTAMVLSYQVRVTGPGGEENYEVGPGDTISLDMPAGGDYEIRVFPATAGDYTFSVEYCAYTDAACGEAAEPGMRFF